MSKSPMKKGNLSRLRKTFTSEKELKIPRDLDDSPRDSPVSLIGFLYCLSCLSFVMMSMIVFYLFD